jgi:deazaflavin-dependent oxidoreductase (nitroreductase family)
VDETVRQALAQGGTIDITTTGRKTGAPRRIEIAFSNVDGTVYITGTPGRPRSWYANLRANPAFTFHLKQGVTADLPAQATPILDSEQRLAILSAMLRRFAERSDRTYDLDDWVAHSPLVSVTFDE